VTPGPSHLGTAVIGVLSADLHLAEGNQPEAVREFDHEPAVLMRVGGSGEERGCLIRGAAVRHDRSVDVSERRLSW